MTIFGRLRRKPAGRHAQREPSAALTVVPGAPSPWTPAPPAAADGARLVPHALQGTPSSPLPPPALDLSTEDPTAPEQVDGTRVGLFFGDGSHVVIDASDPRAGAFASIAEELNR